LFFVEVATFVSLKLAVIVRFFLPCGRCGSARKLACPVCTEKSIHPDTGRICASDFASEHLVCLIQDRLAAWAEPTKPTETGRFLRNRVFGTHRTHIAASARSQSLARVCPKIALLDHLCGPPLTSVVIVFGRDRICRSLYPRRSSRGQ